MAVIKRPSTATTPDGEPITATSQYHSIADIYKQAKAWGIATHPLDIEALLLRQGLRIIREEMEIDVSGYIERRQNFWVIGINKYQNHKRQRFTLAHEFGHFLFDQASLQSGKHVDTILLRSAESDTTEMRANEFAARLLMPKDIFQGYVDQGIRSVEELSDRFEVSMAAIRYRAFKLGLIKSY